MTEENINRIKTAWKHWKDKDRLHLCCLIDLWDTIVAIAKREGWDK